MTELLSQEIKDRFDIHDVMHRYARMVDRRLWEIQDQVFVTDATIDYTSTGGQAGHYKEILKWLHSAL